MKYAINFLVAILLSVFSLSPLHAQNVDQKRMNRDINISKNILQEIFKTTNGSRLQILSNSFSFGSHTDIRGTYLHDYGVIFTIPARRSVFIFKSDDDREDSEVSFAYGGDDNGKEVTENSITNRMKEFLREYGFTIGQLGGNDRITLIYSSANEGHTAIVRAFTTSGQNVKQPPSGDIPTTITVTARKSDLEAYSRGSISTSEFDNRLNITKNEGNENRQDLKIMANILKTSFEDAGSDAFRVRGRVSSSYIDDLGALFYLDASHGSGFFMLNSKIHSLRVNPSNSDSLERAFFDGKTKKNPDERAFFDDKNKEELKKERTEAYQEFLQQLKETLVDYGRTLKSVQSDEQVYISVSLSRSGDEVPERVDLQIKKSILEAVDQGNMSREQAISQINVREY